ncbi:membrane protein [Arthrobacter phage CallinAllBarbz]|uniref:Membrane protein n=1 Tax=Arthrobacter phage CallinAllBarbz TaxID=3077790 RepID=A0AA96HD87_9CAUD|nr:membrane protein [Arthrobacter phage CallinAllBarbz]
MILLLLATIVLAVLHVGGLVILPLWLVFLPLAIAFGLGVFRIVVFLIAAYAVGKGS